MKVKYITACVLATTLICSIKTNNVENENGDTYFAQDNLRIVQFGANADIVVKNIRPTDSIKTVKNKIEQQFKIPAKDQQLVAYNEQTLDSRILAENETLDTIEELKTSHVLRLITPKHYHKKQGKHRE